MCFSGSFYLLNFISVFRNENRLEKTTIEFKLSEWFNSLFDDEDEVSVYTRFKNRELSVKVIRGYVAFLTAYMIILCFAATHPSIKSIPLHEVKNYSVAFLLFGFITTVWFLIFYTRVFVTVSYTHLTLPTKA